jgi:predicted transcriptional regulator of viral defense system
MPARTIQQMLPAMYYARSRGVVRAQDMLARGWEESDIRTAVVRGELRKVGRGLYTSFKSPCTADRPMVAAAVGCHQGVVCLASALHLHGLLAERPAEVWMALPEKAWKPRTDLPLRIVWFSGAAQTEGIETRVIEGVKVNVYSAAKTVADCLKYRKKVGEDVAVAALHEFRRQHPEQVEELERFAGICRVARLLWRATTAA